MIFPWLLFGYLCGSIPSAYILVKVFRHIDIREHGSGNCGATNVFRVAGPWIAVPTLSLDILKGYIPVALAMRSFGPEHAAYPMLVALCAVCGHIWTVFLKFKGGKGVATGAGVFLALMSVPMLCAAGVFAAVTAATRYVSLGSVLAACSLPIFAVLRHEPKSLVACACVLAVLIIIRHRQNMSRLLKGTEKKVTDRASADECRTGGGPHG